MDFGRWLLIPKVGPPSKFLDDVTGMEIPIDLKNMTVNGEPCRDSVVEIGMGYTVTVRQKTDSQFIFILGHDKTDETDERPAKGA